jgi:hypothetical protein
MRTTVTLDSDVSRLLHEEQYRSKKTFKQVLNDSLRLALRPTTRRLPKLLPPVSMGLRTGIDPRALSSVADDLEAEAYLINTRRRR